MSHLESPQQIKRISDQPKAMVSHGGLKQRVKRRASTGLSPFQSLASPSHSNHNHNGQKASLHNNIGVMMLHKNSVDEARDRFHAAILATDSHPQHSDHALISPGARYDQPTPKSVSLVHADIPGLTWFHSKLQRECSSLHVGALPSNDVSDRRSSFPLVKPVNSFFLGQSKGHYHRHRHFHHCNNKHNTTANTPNTAINAHHPMTSFNHNIERYIPLGLEFISLPLYAPQTQTQTQTLTHDPTSSPIKDARCAAYLNLARLLLEFPHLHDLPHENDNDNPNPADNSNQQQSQPKNLITQVLALCSNSLHPLPDPTPTDTRITNNTTGKYKQSQDWNEFARYTPLQRSQSERIQSPPQRPRADSVSSLSTTFSNSKPLQRSPSQRPRADSVSSLSPALSPYIPTKHNTTDQFNGTPPAISPSLQIIARNNIGVLNFSLNRFKEALQEVEAAYDLIKQHTPNLPSPPPHTLSPQSSLHPQERHPVLPYDYLHLVTLFNLSRICIRINDLTRAQRYIDTMALLSPNLVIPPTVQSSPWAVNHETSPYHHQHQHLQHLLHHRYKYLLSLAHHYHSGLLQQRQEHLTTALEHYNAAISLCRRELGHEHIYVATVLEKKGKVLFDQRKLQTAMLSYLAGLRVYEKQVRGNGVGIQDSSSSCSSVGVEWTQNDTVKDQQKRQDEGIRQQSHSEPVQTHRYQDDNDNYRLERSRILYEIGRTLHDREEYSDALRVYQKALSLRQDVCSVGSTFPKKNSPAEMKETIKILTNIGRMQHIMGDLDGAVKANLEIAKIAVKMVGEPEPDDIGSDEINDAALQHAFVRNQFVILGNLYVEAGRLDEAMRIFSRISRQQQRRRRLVDGESSEDLLQSHARPEEEDVDTTSAFAVRAAERLGNVGGKGSRSCTAAAA